MRDLVLEHHGGLGDVVLLSALVRDIHKTYPQQYRISLKTGWTQVWTNNPHVFELNPRIYNKGNHFRMSWRQAMFTRSRVEEDGHVHNRHILGWYHHCFETLTGIRVRPTLPYPDLHLSAAEKAPIISGRYWVILGGGKLDLPVKHWHFHRIQEVVSKLSDITNFVQVGATHKNHIHPHLEGALNFIGKTESIRDLFSLIYNSEGVICGVTGAMHIAAAFQKPCVVFAGGREDPWFEAYTNEFAAFGSSCEPVRVPHKFIHTVGKLPCCLSGGCWKNRVVPIDPADLGRNSGLLCVAPVRAANAAPIAKCQDLILSDDIVSGVRSYYDSGTLPPPVKTPLTVVRDTSVVREQAPSQTQFPVELKGTMSTQANTLSIMDDPVIGGKMTVFLLCYGQYTDLARKCLTSLLQSVPITRLDIRVATNEASQGTVQYLQNLPLKKLYVHPNNDFKYPVMREMFYDESCPITTNYFLWLDDDTFVVDPHWMQTLCQTIISGHPNGYRMYGDLRYHNLANYGSTAVDWFRQARWYGGIPFRGKSRGAETPNGSIIDFAVGWCWAMSTEAMRRADVPDVRLAHNGGDITIGEQMHQAGFGIMQWNSNKKHIACPTRENGGRRGFSQKFPWDNK